MWIYATAATPSFAAQIANTYANQYIAFRRDADRTTILSAQGPLQRQIAALPKSQRFGPLGQSLQERLSQLGVLASLQTGGAELVQPAQLPTGPSSPTPVSNGLLGVFFGIVLGIALVVLVEALDRRLRAPAEAEEIFERPILAALPESGGLTELRLGLARRADRAPRAVPDARGEPPLFQPQPRHPLGRRYLGRQRRRQEHGGVGARNGCRQLRLADAADRGGSPQTRPRGALRVSVA